MKRDQKFTLINLALHIGAVSPTVWLIIALLLHKLGPNPIQTLEQRSGDTALVLLLLTLACTPIRLLTGFSFINRFRRTLGLYTFGYAVIHLLLFVGLDYGFSWLELWPILLQKRYIWFGVVSFVLLGILALTSSRYWQKKLKKNWQRLHWLIYAAGLLVILHFALSLKGNIFLFKGNVLWPLITLAIYLVLMTFRLKPIRHLIGLIRRSNSNS